MTFDRKAARARCEKATPGDVVIASATALRLKGTVTEVWSAVPVLTINRPDLETTLFHEAHATYPVASGFFDHRVRVDEVGGEFGLDLLAAARTDLPAALDALDAADEENARLREELATAKSVLRRRANNTDRGGADCRSCTGGTRPAARRGGAHEKELQMSADNGVYIARFPKSDGDFEYRVTHCQAIDNCDYGDDPEWQDHMRVSYFGGSPMFDTSEAAWTHGRQLEREIMESTFPVLEYGVSEIHFDRPLINESVEEADAWLAAWDNHGQPGGIR